MAALEAQLLALKAQILAFHRRIMAWHRSNETSKRLDAIPGVGPALATALLARRHGQRVAFTRDLMNTLRDRELDAAAAKLAEETGTVHRPSTEGEYITRTFRQRVVLALGRLAVIDDGLAFQPGAGAPGAEPALRPACLRHHDAEQRHRVELWTQARVGDLKVEQDQYFFDTVRYRAMAEKSALNSATGVPFVRIEPTPAEPIACPVPKFSGARSSLLWPSC